MTIDEAEKAYIKQIDDSMGIWQRNDWYKRKTVRKAFRNGWKQALEYREVNNCYTPVVSKCDGIEREALLFAFISWYAEKYEMSFTDGFKNRLIDEFKSKQ
jgi:hypothetical protein